MGDTETGEDRPAAATTEELEARCGHECLKGPKHVERGEPHFYGYIMGPHSYEGVKAERDRERAARQQAEGMVHDLIWYMERDHRMSIEAHDHDCYSEWKLLYDEARRMGVFDDDGEST